MHLYIIDMVHRSGSRIFPALLTHLAFLFVHRKNILAQMPPVRTVIESVEIVGFDTVPDKFQLRICHMLHLHFGIIKERPSGRPSALPILFYILSHEL